MAAVFITGKLARRTENTRIDKVCENRLQIILKPVLIPDPAADLPDTKIRADLLEKQISDIKRAFLPGWNAGSLMEGNGYGAGILPVFFGIFLCLLPGPCHQCILRIIEGAEKIVVLAKLAVDAGRSFSIGLTE